MNTRFYLHAAIALSPGNKAIVELKDHWVCIIHHTPRLIGRSWATTLVDLDTSNDDFHCDASIPQDLDKWFDAHDAFKTVQGESISVALRIWTPLEWWQQQHVEGTAQ